MITPEATPDTSFTQVLEVGWISNVIETPWKCPAFGISSETNWISSGWEKNSAPCLKTKTSLYTIAVEKNIITIYKIKHRKDAYK